MIASGNHTIDSSDISRPKANEREPYSRTAQSRYPAGRQIAAPYELRIFFRLPFNRQLRPITLRAAGIRPYGLAVTIQFTLNEERTTIKTANAAGWLRFVQAKNTAVSDP